MARVTGIGGVFFRAKDPKGLRDWYVEHLGFPVDEQGFVVFQWKDGSDDERPGSTVWAPFVQDTDYLGDNPEAMINFRVDDLEALLANLKSAGVDVDDKRETIDGLGVFGWFTDPEGNRVELWEPAEGC